MPYEDMLTAFLVEPSFISTGVLSDSRFLGAVADLSMPEITARQEEMVDGYGNSELGPIKGLNLASRQMTFNMREMHPEIWQNMFRQRNAEGSRFGWLIYGSLGSDQVIGETQILAERQLKISLQAEINGMDSWQMTPDTATNWPVRLYLAAIRIEQAALGDGSGPGDPSTLCDLNWDTGVFKFGGGDDEFDILAARRQNLGLAS